MKETIELLKKTREEKNLTLHEVGMTLKINPKTLQAIENWETDKLPPKTFLRGFIKSYALYLKLDANAILNNLRFSTLNPTTIEPTIPQGKKETPLVAKVKSEAPVVEKIKLEKALIFVGIVFFSCVVILIAKLVDKYQKERGSEKAKEEIVQQVTKEATPESATVVESKPSEPLVESSKSKTELAVNENPLLSFPISPPAETSAEKVNPEKSKQTSEPSVSVSTSMESKPAQPEVVSSKPTELILEAKDKVQIKFDLNDGNVQTLDLQSGDIHTLKSNKKINLEISDAGNVTLIVNGYQRSYIGKSGRPVKLSYPK